MAATAVEEPVAISPRRVVIHVRNRPTPVADFLSELRLLNISDDIAVEANKIWEELPATYKKNKKKQYKHFYCIYNAANRLGEPFVPKDVADIVGLPYNKMTKALKKFPKCVGPKHISFISLIPRYCERLGVDKNSITYIQNCGEDLLRKDPELDDDFPQNIAVATILYYLTISGVEINRREYSKTVGLSEVTITNIYKKIMGIDNKMIC